MRNLLKWLTVLPAVGLFISCSSDAVKLTYTNCKDEVPTLGNLVFEFNKALFPDSLLNRWDSTDFVSFEPKVPGRFRWESPERLIFSPLAPLAPATDFKATITSEALVYSKYTSVGGGDKLNFHTPDLKLENSNIIWSAADANNLQPFPQVDLYFNYPVRPESLSDRLLVEVEGEKASYRIQTLNADDKISVQLLEMKPEDKDYSARVTLQKGIIPEGGKNATKEDIIEKVVIPSPYRLVILNTETQHDGVSGSIKVTTSQEIASEKLASFIKLDPAIKFGIEVMDDGFLITSEGFDISKGYTLNVSKGLRGKIGGIMKEDYRNDISFGKLEPTITFVNSKGEYLSAKGNKNLEVRILNVPKVRLVISKIYENNLLQVQRYGYYPRLSSNDDEEWYYPASGIQTGDVIIDKEIDIRTLPKYGNSRIFNFDIEDKLPDFKGIYHISMRSLEDYWVSDSRFVSLSDIGLIAREGKDKMYVFANSIKSAESLNGVNVVVYGKNNQVLGVGTTNNDGVAEVEYIKRDYSGFHPEMVIAKTGDDFNYMPFSSTQVSTSRFDVGGKRSNSTGFDAYIYAERDIYRPGEKVNFSVILRNRQWKSPGEIPIKLKFLLPNGNEFRSFRKMLNKQGSAEGNIDISAAAITGTYTLEVYTSNDILLANKSFFVEEFVPDRIKVNAELDRPFLKPGDTTLLKINAVNFFGPPAANRNYECEIQLKQKQFLPRHYEKYYFNLANQSFSDKVLREGETDQKGNAAEAYSVPDKYKNMGILQANFYTTVFDETGRPVSKLSSADVFTQGVFFGIGFDGYNYYALNQVVRFPLVALNKDEQVLNNARAKVQIVKHEYRTKLARSGDYFRYVSDDEERIIKEQEITISGTSTTFPFTPVSSGRYEIRIAAPDAGSYVTRNFYSYGYWGSDNSSFEVNTEGEIDIDLDKDGYEAGETANAIFKTPFNGRMLVTLETDKVISYQYVEVDKRLASVSFKLSEEHLPNVYITATLFKPHELSDIPLTVAHGFKSIKVDIRSRKIPVTITAEKTVRSRTHQKVKVKAEPNSMVTLAAVDNGVLQVSGMKTPDPYNYFYAKYALGVRSYNIYALLLPELRPRLSSTGGDEGELEKRVNPVPNKRIKIVSYWSGIQKANGNGEANFEFDIPQFSGEVRLMAVAYKDEDFGSGENNMTVADPIVISTALPRFMTPGDTVLMPVTLSNTTKKNASTRTSVSVSGPLQVVGISKQNLDIDANNEGRVFFKLTAGQKVDSASVKVNVQALGENFGEEINIPVRPASPLQVDFGNGTIEAGSSKSISIPVGRFLEGTSDYRLVLSRSPVLEVADQMEYLVHYPYGCSEQTISSAFPQLYFSDLSDLLQKDQQSKQTAVYFVQEAIRKLKMRQLYTGAITLWDDEGTEHWWVSVYAAHFLFEAKRAGFDVDDNFLNPLLGYLTNQLKNRTLITYYYNRNQNRQIAPKEVPYSLYVLALAGRPQVSAMNYYKLNPDKLSLDGKYLLSAAYAVAGDKSAFRDLLPQSFTGEVSVAQTGGSFYSDIRDEAIALNALIDVDPGNVQIPLMAKHVVEKLKGRSWYSTQESAFSFVAIGKLARSSVKTNITAEVKVNGKTVGKLSNADIKLSAKQLGGNNFSVTALGTGRLYYFWQAEGIDAKGNYKEEDSYIKVRRSFYDRYGRQVTGNTFKQNDLIVVALTLESAYSGKVENIVITDLLPGGFEIENPRTKEIPGMEWIKNAATPAALDIRDDRIHMFTDINYNSRQTFYYAVRAVSPGQFKLGPVSAEAMYNGEYHSYNGAGTANVVQ